MNLSEESLIEIFLVEDHADFRRTLAMMLNENPRFHCSSFANAEDVLLGFKKVIPDVVIMDINLPGLSGIECTRWIKQHYPAVLVMQCTVHEDDDKIFDALRSGASGYILKSATIEDIQLAVLDLIEGGSPMSPAIARKVVTSFRNAKDNNNLALLTSREQQVLDLLAEGKRIKEIAPDLFISVNTVRTHIRNLYEKLEVQSRTEAINKAGKSIYPK